MPRFFFHLHNDLEVRDEEGQELPDLTAARAAAIRNGRELMCEKMMEGALDLSHSIEVADETGRSLMTIPFGDMVEIRP